jgi:hypothetical protein
MDFVVAKTVPGMILPGSSTGGLGGLFIFFAGWCFIMTLWAMFQVHETMNLSLEHVDTVFEASSWDAVGTYSMKNFWYSFYFGPQTMFQYTQHDIIEFKHQDKKDYIPSEEGQVEETKSEKRRRSSTVDIEADSKLVKALSSSA